MASDVTHEHRRAFAAYANAILESKKQSDNLLVHGFLDQLYERIIDMEHPAFRQNYPNVVPIPNATEAQKFVYMLMFQQSNVMNKLLLDTMRKSGTNIFSSDTIKNMDTLSYALLKQKVIEKLADILHKQNFCLQYNIALEDLELLAEFIKTSKTRTLDSLTILEKLAPFFLEDLMQEIELDGEKMTVLECSKRGARELEKMDISTQLFARMSGKKSTNTDKDSPTVEPGLVHRRVVIFEKNYRV